MFKNTKAFSSFSVNDIQKAKDFYGWTLGLDVAEVPEMKGLLNVNIEGGGKVMLYEKPNHIPATFTVLNFTVTDVEKTVDELIKRGIKFEQYGGQIKTDAKGIAEEEVPLIAWFEDSAGNILSVVEKKY